MCAHKMQIQIAKRVSRKMAHAAGHASGLETGQSETEPDTMAANKNQGMFFLADQYVDIW